MRTLARRVRCWWFGHEVQLHLEAGVLSLHCPLCGYESPGWACGPHVLHFEAPSTRARAKRVVRAKYRSFDPWLMHDVDDRVH